MKFVRLCLFLLCSIVGPIAAQQEPPADRAAPPSAAVPAPDAPAAPAAVAPEPDSAPAAPTPEAAPAATEPADSPAPEPAKDSELRELGVPAAPAAAEKTPARRERRGHGREVVSFGGAHLGKGDDASKVVAIMGDAKAEGEVREDVVAIMGNSSATERVGGAVVAIMGNARASSEVRRDVVAIMGNSHVEGRVGHSVVAIMGNIDLGPEARVHGDAVSIGGKVNRAPGAEVHGNITELPIVGNGLGSFGSSVGTWFRETVLKARLLAFDSEVLWPWVVAALFLLFYLLLALVFGRAVTRCAEILEQRPARTFLAAFLTLIATPPLMLILAFTGIGPIILFFVLLIGSLFGKASLLAWLGRRFTLRMGWTSAAAAVLVGGVLLMLLYTVPVLGLLLWKLGSVLGLGMAVYACIVAMSREKPGAPSAPTPSPLATPGSAVVAGVVSAPTPTPVVAAGAVPPLPSSVPLATAPVPSVPMSALPRAGFWLRLGASLLDAILIAIIVGLLHIGGGFLFIFAAYHIVMWSLKGTTIGGIIFGLKVVRLDERKLDWTIALVRALSAFLSVAIVGIGFIWVVFDDQKQSWHDKIAGTTVVRLPKGVSLL